MNAEISKLLQAFENALFASASDEYNERANHRQIKERYDRVNSARAALIAEIEALEKPLAQTP